MSSRQAQCSTIIPSATRQMWMNVHAAGRPDTGAPASSGIVEARWVPCSVRCCATRSPSPTRWCCSTEVGPRSPSIVRRMCSQALAALGTGGVVHHVRRDEVVEHGVVAGLHAVGTSRSRRPSALRSLTMPARLRGRRAVMPAGCPAGHCTSSMRQPSGSVTHVVQKSSVPSGEVGASASTPGWRARHVVVHASTWTTRWLRPPGSTGPGRVVDELDRDELVVRAA